MISFQTVLSLDGFGGFDIVRNGYPILLGGVTREYSAAFPGSLLEKGKAVLNADD